MRERKPIDEALRRFLDEEAAPSGDLAQMTDEALVRLGRALIVRAQIPLPAGSFARSFGCFPAA
jgi:hypothetical protein